MKFQIITAAYDCPQYIKACLQATAEQRLDGFDMEVCVVLDNPPNPEWQRHFITDFCEAHGWRYIINTRRMGALYNQVAAIALLGGAPEDVIVFVDGDDRLAHPEVLQTLWTQAYRDPNILVTYGSYVCEPPSPTSSGPVEIPKEAWWWPGGFRRWAAVHYNMCFNHLRTFRRKVFMGMTIRDWTWPAGDWFVCAPDSAMMIPAIELAGEGRIHMFKEPLLIYTADHEQAEWRLRPREIDRVNAYILRQLPAKTRLP